MDSEKNLLKKELATLEKKEDIEKFFEDVEVMGGHDDVVELAKEKIAALGATADVLETTSESQEKQIEELGGSDEQVEALTVKSNDKIETVKVTAEKKILAVNEGGAIKETGQENKEVGYDNALNMYASSLTNPADLEKYKDVFAKLSPEDKAKIEQGVVGLQIKDAMLNWGVPEVETKFSENMENYSKMFPGSVESAKIYSTMTTPNFNPTKFQEMYSVSGEQLGRMLQDAKDKIIEDIKKEESIDTNNLRLQYSELINTTKDSDEKSRLERTLQVKVSEIIDVSTKNKIGKINEDYQKRLEQVNH